MRLDKYLKITRLIKRRTIANEACDAGKIVVNDKIARASYDVKVGDIIEINMGSKPLKVKVLNVTEYATKENAAEKYAVGNVVTGKVARMTDFGAFVELEPGVDALLHVSQIAKEHIEKPSDVLSVGDEVTAKVVDFNEADHKISLSVKALTAPEPAEAEEESDADVVSVDIDAVIAAEAENTEE